MANQKHLNNIEATQKIMQAVDLIKEAMKLWPEGMDKALKSQEIEIAPYHKDESFSKNPCAIRIKFVW